MIHMARRWATKKLRPRAPISVGRMRRLSSRLTSMRPGMRVRRAGSRRATGIHCLDSTARAYPAEARELQRRLAGDLPADFAQDVRALTDKVREKAATIASRKASQDVIEALAPGLPELLGGSADLAGSNLTMWSGSKSIGKPGGNYIHYGVREFGMAAIMNGIALHGGFIPYGGTFLTFSDYCRNALRMAALMKIRSIFVFTHDSIGLGEDGPTHQAVEHVASLAADSQHGRVASL